MTQDRNAILTEALAHREGEVLMHQINIDNYRLALAEIEANYPDDDSLVDFANTLKSLLETSIVEQRKEIIMRDVIAKQLGD